MALRKYLRPLNGLPDPSGSLSSRIPSAAIAEANRLVTERLDTRHLPHAVPFQSRVLLVNNFSWGLNFHGLPPPTKISPRQILTHEILTCAHENMCAYGSFIAPTIYLIFTINTSSRSIAE